MPYNTPEYQAQAKIITRLNDEIRRLKDDYLRLRTKHEASVEAGEFYKQMQELILAHPVLQAAWSDFVATMILVAPEIKDNKAAKVSHKDPFDYA